MVYLIKIPNKANKNTQNQCIYMQIQVHVLDAIAYSIVNHNLPLSLSLSLPLSLPPPRISSR